MTAAARGRAGDERGSTIVEYAMLLPVMLAMMMGGGELAYTSYVRAILTGAMQKAARDSGIQGGDLLGTTLDNNVLAMVRRVSPGAAFATGYPVRKSYAQYGFIAPEPFNDANNNGRCDNGEPYTDVNRNGSWDQDPGITGQGGASDATVYTIVLNYPRLFPVSKIVGMSASGSVTSTVILKNQPYSTQSNGTAPPTMNCP